MDETARITSPNELTREQSASVFAFELGCAVIKLILLQQQLGHTSVEGTARDYIHPSGSWADPQHVAYELARGETNLSAEILARNGWTLSDIDTGATR